MSHDDTYFDYMYEYHYLSPEEQKEREENRKDQRWFRKTSLKPLGLQTAKICRDLGYKDIEDVRRDMLKNQVLTLAAIMNEFRSKQQQARHVAIRILEALGIQPPPPKAVVTCKCCKQDIRQMDDIDKAIEMVKPSYA